MADIKRIELTEEPIWTIQSDETVAQYRAFCLYRDLGRDRALSKVAEALAREKATEQQRESNAKATKSDYLPGHLAKWSAENRWVERAEAYETHLERERRQTRETEIAKAEQREIQMANIAMSGVMRRLIGYIDAADPSKNVAAVDWSKLTPSEVANTARIFVDIHRLATGRPTSFVRSTTRITMRDYEDLANGLIEVLLPYVSVEDRSAAIEAADAFLAEGGKL